MRGSTLNWKGSTASQIILMTQKSRHRAISTLSGDCNITQMKLHQLTYDISSMMLRMKIEVLLILHVEQQLTDADGGHYEKGC